MTALVLGMGALLTISGIADRHAGQMTGGLLVSVWGVFIAVRMALVLLDTRTLRRSRR